MFLPVQPLNVITPGTDLCFFPSKPTIVTGWALVCYAKLSNILSAISECCEPVSKITLDLTKYSLSTKIN